MFLEKWRKESGTADEGVALVSTWRERSQLGNTVCAASAEYLLPFALGAEVDAVTDFHDDEAAEEVVRRLTEIANDRHEREESPKRNKGRWRQEVPYHLALDLHDAEHRRLFVLSTYSCISADLFDERGEKELLFGTADCGAVASASLNSVQFDGLKDSLRRLGIEIGDVYETRPR